MCPLPTPPATATCICVCCRARREAAHAGKPFLGVHNNGFIADTTEQALETFWPISQRLFTKLGRER